MKIDLIVMGAEAYSIFEKEMRALDRIPNEGGFTPNFDFNGVPCHYARITRNQIRFVAESKIVTGVFNPTQGGIFGFLKLHIGAVNAALQGIDTCQ